jgi:hypothetical protein
MFYLVTKRSMKKLEVIVMHNKHNGYLIILSTEKKNSLKRDQALNDATSGQFGEEPSDIPQEHSEILEYEDARKKAARKLSKNMK